MAALRCPNCGAPNPGAMEQPGQYHCDYCKTSFDPQKATPAAKGAAPVGLLLGCLVALVGVAVVVRLRSSTPARPPVVPVTVEAAVPEPAPGFEAAFELVPPNATADVPAWASARVYPIGVDADGDGTEDLLGPTLVKDGANAQIYVSVFDGKTFEHRFRVGPFGTPQGDAESAVSVVAAGQRFVVLDAHGDAHLYELADGKLVTDFPFREKNRGMCGPPGRESKVLVRVGPGNFVIDTANAKGAKGAEPPWCQGDKYMRRRASESFNHYSGTQAEKLQQVGFTSDRLARYKPPPKMSLVYAYVDGTQVVGVAAEQGGGSDGMLVGFDAKGGIAYQVAGGPLGLTTEERGSDLAHGRFVFRTRNGKVVSIDAKTGDKQWEAELADGESINRMTITEGRVWVTANAKGKASVHALDATTGAVLGTVRAP